MPRDIVLGNQCLLVNIDKWLQIRDIFYPHVGEENHVQGHAHKIGVWTENRFSWVNEEPWERDLDYDKNTLVSHAVARNNELQVSLHLHDCVSCDHNIYLKKVSVKNESDRQRQIKVFFYHDFLLYGNDIGDTAGYDALRNSIFHYKKKRYFMMNAINEETCTNCDTEGDIAEYSCGHKDYENGKGTWMDAEDGSLEMSPIAQGSVDSAISMHLDLEPGEIKVFYYWIAAGQTREEIIELNDLMMKEHPDKILEITAKCWKGIIEAHPREFKDLGEEAENLYHRSLLAIISNTDKDGAILAANDTDNMKFNKDTYSYCWPRDGALVALALDKAGYHEYSKKFFEFCSRVISKHGVLLHKYNPDGSLGSTWHPWVKDGKPHLPIQEDETALVVYALWYHYNKTRDKKFARKMYDKIIIPAADFMCRHTREDNLPHESYDLWEEREGILTYTVSTVIAGLKAAANFCEVFENPEKEQEYRRTADYMKDAMEDLLWDDDEKRFLRMANFDGEDVVEDKTPEASTSFVWALGCLPPNDFKIENNMESIRKNLWLNTHVGGISRYSGDYYHRVSEDVPGNPWLITTMWYGQWLVAKAKELEDLQPARDIVNWVIDNATQSGMLPEQLDPYTGEALSVSPLTWSHATFVELVNDYIHKYSELE